MYVTHFVKELKPGDFLKPITKDQKGYYKMYRIQISERIETIKFDESFLKLLNPAALQALYSHEETIFLNESEIRGIQEHYSILKGWRVDTSNAHNRSLGEEIAKDRMNQLQKLIKQG